MFATNWKLSLVALTSIPTAVFISKVKLARQCSRAYERSHAPSGTHVQVYGEYYKRLSKRTQSVVAKANSVVCAVLNLRGWFCPPIAKTLSLAHFDSKLLSTSHYCDLFALRFQAEETLSSIATVRAFAGERGSLSELRLRSLDRNDTRLPRQENCSTTATP